MIISIDLHQNIYDQLSNEAEEKGLTVEEYIRVMLGEHARFLRAIPLPSISIVQPPIMDKAYKMVNMLINQMVASGGIKCPNCTMSLDSEALEKGECSACGYKV